MATVTFEPLPANLAEIQVKIEGYARDYGLDFYPTIFELIDADQLNAIAAYGGFPTRYPHWRFGMEYEQLNKGYTYGLQKIYELVINNNPCYAYLMRCNGLVDQKLVMAHVYGHCDFFKNNYWFSQTNRKMMDEMANHGNRIRRYMDRFGVEEVEKFIDACLSIEDLIDIHSPFIKRFDQPSRYDFERGTTTRTSRPARRAASSPRTTWIRSSIRRRSLAAEAEQTARAAGEADRSFPPEPVRDVMLFVLEHAPLKPWQLDVLSIIRDEAYYFAPQAPDQDHERRLGQLLALHDHDPPGARRGRRRELLRPSLRHAGQFAHPAESVQAGHRTVPRHRRPLEQAAASARSTTSATTWSQSATGTPAPAWAGRRSSKSARSTTT